MEEPAFAPAGCWRGCSAAVSRRGRRSPAGGGGEERQRSGGGPFVDQSGRKVDATEADGATALAWAAHRDNLETADLLLRAGANPNLANTYGVTPLTLACVNRSAAMVETLLRAGADPNQTQWTGETALMTCARTGRAEAVQIPAVSATADVNAEETRQGDIRR